MARRGDLLLVPFPFTDLSATKRRPVLALTDADGYGDFVALQVTSRPQAGHGVLIGEADMLTGVLPAPSCIRTNRIVTLNRSLVMKPGGTVADFTLSDAITRVCLYIGYSRIVLLCRCVFRPVGC